MALVTRDIIQGHGDEEGPNTSGDLLGSLICLLFALAPALAGLQPLDFSLNATPASSLDLSGKWHAARDPGDTGKSAEWFRRGPTPDVVPIEVPGPVEVTFPGYDGVT